jgi:hypothetical protein
MLLLMCARAGNWDSRAGTLVVAALPSITRCSAQPIPSGDLLCLPEVRLQFELLNSELPQAAVSPVISASGGGLVFPDQKLAPVLGIQPQTR